MTASLLTWIKRTDHLAWAGFCLAYQVIGFSVLFGFTTPTNWCVLLLCFFAVLLLFWMASCLATAMSYARSMAFVCAVRSRCSEPATCFAQSGLSRDNEGFRDFEPVKSCAAMASAESPARRRGRKRLRCVSGFSSASSHIVSAIKGEAIWTFLTPPTQTNNGPSITASKESFIVCKCVYMSRSRTRGTVDVLEIRSGVWFFVVCYVYSLQQHWCAAEKDRHLVSNDAIFVATKRLTVNAHICYVVFVLSFEFITAIICEPS